MVVVIDVVEEFHRHGEGLRSGAPLVKSKARLLWASLLVLPLRPQGQ